MIAGGKGAMNLNGPWNISDSSLNFMKTHGRLQVDVAKGKREEPNVD